MANPIQRLVRFVFDRSAANKAETDSKKSLGRIGKGFDSLKSKALALGGVLAAAFSIRALVRFGKESVRIASEATAIWGRLEQAVENAGVSFDKARPQIDAMARAMQDATTVGDEDFADILAELITTSGDYEKSLNNVQTVADLAAAKNLELRSAAMLVGRAMVGQTSTLTRYGIVVREGEDAMEVLRQQFRGFAENEAQTFDGMIKQLNNEWSDFRQAIGDVMIEAGNGTSILQTITATLKVLTQRVNDNRTEIAAWGQVIFAVGKAIIETFRFIVRVGKNAFEALAGGLAMLTNDLSQTWAKTINVILEGINKIPWINIDFRFNELTPEEFATQQRLLSEGIEENASNMKDALWDLAEAYQGVGQAARDAASAQSEATPSSSDDSGGGVSITDVPVRIITDPSVLMGTRDEIIRIFEDLEMSIPNQIMKGFQDELRTSRDLASLIGGEYDVLQTEVDLLTFAMQNLLDAGLRPTDERLQALAGRLRDVQNEQDMVTKQHELMASVAASTGEVLNAAFGAGIGQLAASKAKQNAIMAAEQAAMGFVASLNPFTAPKAAGHFAAAGQFAGIAAAWGALGAATGGFSGGGGSSGVGGLSGSRGVASERSGSLSDRGAEVNIYLTGEGFDAINPKVQNVVQGALREAQASTGPNARVRIYRQSSMTGEN